MPRRDALALRGTGPGIENRAGAGGTIGSLLVAKAAPDGYTLVISGIGSHVIAPVDSPNVFDPIRDFSHIALLGGPPLAMVVNAEQPIEDVKAFVAHVAANPQGLSCGSPGQGTHGHLTGELFRTATKLNMVHISYKGAGPAVADLVANQIPCCSCPSGCRSRWRWRRCWGLPAPRC